MKEKRRAVEGSAEYVVIQDGCSHIVKRGCCMRENGLYLKREGQRVRRKWVREVPKGDQREQSERNFCKTWMNLFRRDVTQLLLSLVTENVWRYREWVRIH